MPADPVQTYYLHSRFDQICNYVSPAGELHSLSLPALGAGPGVTLVAQLPDPPPEQLLIGSQKEWISPKSLKIIDSCFDPKLSTDLKGPHSSPAWQTALEKRIEALAPLVPETMRAFLKEWESGPKIDIGKNMGTISQAFMNQIGKGLAALQSGHYLEGTRQLRGVGPGLTPSGDDILCGFLYALSTGDSTWDTARDIIYTNARGTNPISNHFLVSAQKGLFFEHIKQFTELSLRFMQALSEHASPHPSQHELENSCKRVLEHGATSGADTLIGLLHGWHHMTSY